jgi:hypothetical protein
MWNRRGEINSEDVMDNNNKKIIKERCFLLGGEKFIAVSIFPQKTEILFMAKLFTKKTRSALTA